MSRFLGTILVAASLAATASAKAEDIVVTQYKADPSGAPYGIALAKGFFKKHNVDITEVISGEGGGTSVRNVIASALGYGETSPAPVISAIKEGQDLKIVDLGTRNLATQTVLVMPNSPIKTVADAKGKKWGITNPQSVSEMTAALTISQAGLVPNTDVKLVALGGMAGMLAGLESGAVDVGGSTSGTEGRPV